MTPDEVRDAVFTAATWRGYRRAAVDELVQRAAIQIEAGQSPARLVENANLEVERGGYSRRQVDGFLRELTDGWDTDSGSTGSWAQLGKAVGVRAVLILGVGAVIGALAGPAASATLLVFMMVVLQPVLGRRRYLRFLLLVRRQPSARVRFYAGGIAGAWINVGAVAIIGAFAGRSARGIGLTAHAVSRYEATQGHIAIAYFAILLVVTTVIIWRTSAEKLSRLRRLVLPIAQMLPTSPVERLTFAGVAITAGICEEILYRGFGIAYLRWIDPSIGRTSLVLITATAFGLAHLYQGPRNVLLTGIAGGIFASLTLATGTLLPAIVIHVLVDLRACVMPPKLVRQETITRRT